MKILLEICLVTELFRIYLTSGFETIYIQVVKQYIFFSLN